MKRHESLVPLSRFHRSCLFLALISKENAPNVKGYPTDVGDKIVFAKNFYKQQLAPHFLLEQKLWDYVSGKSDSLTTIIDELRIERLALTDLFDQLTEKGKLSTLYSIGELLEKHVRKEERVLFQQIQTDLTEEELLSISELLSS